MRSTPPTAPCTNADPLRLSCASERRVMALAQLGGIQAQEPASHNELLNLMGAFEDVQDLGIASPFLQELILAVTQRANELHTAQGDVVSYPSGVCLGHRRLQGERKRDEQRKRACIE